MKYIFLILQFIILGLLVGNFWATYSQTEELKRIANVEAEKAIQEYRVATECQQFNKIFKW